MQELYGPNVDPLLLQLAQNAAGRGAATVTQALDWLVQARESMTAEMVRWHNEARRLGSTMEAWPNETSEDSKKARAEPRMGF